MITQIEENEFNEDTTRTMSNQLQYQRAMQDLADNKNVISLEDFISKNA